MPVLLFPDAAHFLVKRFVPVKNPVTGRITYQRAGRKWVKCDLWDPVQREHAHNYYLTLCPWISQEDRDKVASEWADIREAREAEEKKAEEKKAKEKNALEKKRKIAAMVEENEGVAMNIAKVEKAMKKGPQAGEKGKGWMDVVMGD